MSLIPSKLLENWFFKKVFASQDFWTILRSLKKMKPPILWRVEECFAKKKKSCVCLVPNPPLYTQLLVVSYASVQRFPTTHRQVWLPAFGNPQHTARCSVPCFPPLDGLFMFMHKKILCSFSQLLNWWINQTFFWQPHIGHPSCLLCRRLKQLFTMSAIKTTLQWTAPYTCHLSCWQIHL